ncbi:MAG: pantoate--beta-alanine ligase, partial [Bacteroidia bacterium]|nr:pantoate--beta-alanine ligase [Bacteroidia bacterium]
MILFKKAIKLTNWLNVNQNKGHKIGFVPSMGALHAGHISLIELSKKNNSITVCSIFINPTQFNDKKDFEKYPHTLEKDIYLLEKAGCDILFFPSVKEIYPTGIPSEKHYDLDYLETVLEGKFRPGHFQGVCMVMDRLLHIVKPDRLYLGQKDYQQCLVITKLISLIGMNDLVEVLISPTLREADGLAFSSRNMRLNNESRKNAITIYESLSMIKQKLNNETIEELKKLAQLMLEKNDFKVDYVEIADVIDLS